MPSWLDIKDRIGAIENIKKITRAMQLVAAAKFSRSQGRARSGRPYSQELEDILSALASVSGDAAESNEPLTMQLNPELAPISVDLNRLFEQKDVKRPAIVLVTSDRGLCGAFNTRLIRAARQFQKDHPEMDCKLVTLGKKGYQFFKRREMPIIHHQDGISDRLNLTEIRNLTDKLLRLFVEDEVDGLYIIYAQFRSAMVSDVKIEKFLSIPPVEGKTEDDVYILEPDRDAVYKQLIPLYMTTKIYATLADSFASEDGARMTAMQMATKNAEELHDELVVTRNRLRQALITRELAEIVGGAQL